MHTDILQSGCTPPQLDALQVLNMKPPEILGLLEEVRLFWQKS